MVFVWKVCVCVVLVMCLQNIYIVLNTKPGDTRQLPQNWRHLQGESGRTSNQNKPISEQTLFCNSWRSEKQKLYKILRENLIQVITISTQYLFISLNLIFRVYISLSLLVNHLSSTQSCEMSYLDRFLNIICSKIVKF